MLIIRPVRKSDLNDLFRLAEMAGSGMTTLPADKKVLAQNIAVAEDSFGRMEHDKDDYFLLVLEDTEKNQVVGTSGVYARTGTRQAFYAYRLMSVTHYSHSLNRQSRSGLLHLTNDYTDSSEVGTLFLDPAYRGNGHWLSRARYMLMAQYPDRFASDVIAELRGWFDENGESPFWNAIGAHFFGMSYDEADRMCGQGSNQFITELMPKYPIYTSLISKIARESLGKPHRATKRAMELLLAEGFVHEELIDIFDGGPLVRGKVDQLKSVKAARQVTVTLGRDPGERSVILANRSMDGFRLVYQPGKMLDDKMAVSGEVAGALNLQEGDQMMMIDSD